VAGAPADNLPLIPNTQPGIRTMRIRPKAVSTRTASMTRTHRGLLIIPTLAMAACGGGGGGGSGGESAAVAQPPAGAPADATPWQVRPAEPCAADSTGAGCPADTASTR
jgi:hypothetical protein